MTAQLSWHVQNFVVITQFQSGSELNEISANIAFVRKMFSETVTCHMMTWKVGYCWCGVDGPLYCKHSGYWCPGKNTPLVTTDMTHICSTGYHRYDTYHKISNISRTTSQQGKSEGFESCDRPIVRKGPIWVKIGDVLSRVTLKFDGWPWKTIGHLSFAVSSFVQHFIAIGEFKLELLSGIAQFGSNSTIFRAVWPWNLTDDLEKQ